MQGAEIYSFLQVLFSAFRRPVSTFCITSAANSHLAINKLSQTEGVSRLYIKTCDIFVFPYGSFSTGENDTVSAGAEYTVFFFPVRVIFDLESSAAFLMNWWIFFMIQGDTGVNLLNK